MSCRSKQTKNILYIVIDEKDGVPIMQDPKDKDVKMVRFQAMKLNGEEMEKSRTMKRCSKCGCNVIAEQQNVKSGWYSIRCANLNCCHTSIEMPFMWLARIAWNKEKGIER